MRHCGPVVFAFAGEEVCEESDREAHLSLPHVFTHNNLIRWLERHSLHVLSASSENGTCRR